MRSINEATARAFLKNLSSGVIPDSLVTENMIVWTTSSGYVTIAKLIGGAGLLAKVFHSGFEYHIDSITEQDDRLIAEVHSTGMLIDGQDYHSVQVFIFRFNDGRIVSLAEHMNPITVQEKLAPLFAKIAPPSMA